MGIGSYLCNFIILTRCLFGIKHLIITYFYFILKAKLQEQKETSDSKSSKCDEIGASTKNSTIINNINGAVNNASVSSSAEDKLSKV